MMSRWDLIRWIRRATGLYGRPNFFIVGVQKSGTTSLWECLLQHPCVLFRAKKEMHYWEGRNYDASLQWYESHFPGWLEKKIRAGARSGPLLSGEATPVMGNGTNAPTRLREAYPNLRILVMLRDPVQRAYSHYKHLRRHHPENVPQNFREALEEVKDITRRGMYASHLRDWFSLFGREQVVVLHFGRFVRDPQCVADRCFSFLGVPSVEVRARHANQSSGEKKMSAVVEEELREFYRPHNRELYELLGCDFGWPA